MARANLNVDASLTEAFIAAQEASSTTRLLKISIEDERLNLQRIGSRLGSNNAEQDFSDVLLSSVSDTEAALILFCLTESGSKSWLFLLWVPDLCRVRDKMLYSSSKEDLKRSLGQGYFTAEYSANLRSDLSWAAFQESLKKERTADLLSEKERSVAEERIASHAESSATKSSAMNVLPFSLSAECTAALASFQEEKESNWVEMTLDGESVQLVSKKTVTSGVSLVSHISDSAARFIAVRLSKTTEGQHVSFFIFSCPESVPVRQKMTMASAKATVLAAALEKGMVFDRLIELREAGDIDDVLRQELQPETSSLSPSSAAASLIAKKPARPGQKSRTNNVLKFMPDEN